MTNPTKVKKEKKSKNEKKEKKEKKENKIQDETPLAVDKVEKRKESSETEAPSKKQKKGKSTVSTGYSEHSEIAKVSADEVKKYRAERNITLESDQEYKPITKFEFAGFSDSIMKYCKKFSTPTPIQSSCWPILLSKRDVIGIAETGSGKTLTFTLPGLMHLERKENFSKKLPTILVLAPTRELAMQTYETCTELSKFCTISSVCLYGGVPKDTQRKDLKKGAHVVVATPGRLKDLIEEGHCDLSQVTYVVLDEADRMLDFGFEKEVRDILSKTNPNRQTVMFSATWPESIRKLASEFLKSPVKVTIGSDDLEANKNVSQFVEVLDDPFGKDKKLIQLLNKYHASRKNRVLVFVLYKKEAARVEGQLKRNGYNVRAIHGDMSQVQRIESLNAFKDGSSPLLVATDVAARGLDIPNVEAVINYTFPLTIDEYIHRIGRTGRAGNKGISHTLFTQHDKAHAGSLANVLKAANVQVPESLLKFGTSVKKKEHGAYGAFYKDVDPAAKPTKITFD